MVADDAEGFIVAFTNGDKIKIKGAEYCRLHKVMTCISTLSVWDCLRNNDSLEEILKDVPDEFYAKIKEYRDDLQGNFNFVKVSIEQEFKLINKKLGEVSDKEFALYITNHRFKSFLFSLRNGRVIDQAIWTMIRPEFMKL
jgi:RNA ligase